MQKVQQDLKNGTMMRISLVATIQATVSKVKMLVIKSTQMEMRRCWTGCGKNRVVDRVRAAVMCNTLVPTGAAAG